MTRPEAAPGRPAGPRGPRRRCSPRRRRRGAARAGWCPGRTPAPGTGGSASGSGRRYTSRVVIDRGRIPRKSEQPAPAPQVAQGLPEVGERRLGGRSRGRVRAGAGRPPRPGRRAGTAGRAGRRRPAPIAPPSDGAQRAGQGEGRHVQAHGPAPPVPAELVADEHDRRCSAASRRPPPGRGAGRGSPRSWRRRSRRCRRRRTGEGCTGPPGACRSGRSR